MRILALFAGFALFASGCASIQQAMHEMATKECVAAPADQLGQNAGRNGQTSAQTGEFLNKCSSNGAPVDATAFNKGYQEGLKGYCTRENGELIGREGKEYQKQCPLKLEKNFLAGYNVGKREYERNQLQAKQMKAVEGMMANAPKIPTAGTGGGLACRFNSDCEVKRECNLSTRTCAHNGNACTFDSDCTDKGLCLNSMCQFGQAQQPRGQKCAFASDCEIKNSCNLSTRTCANNGAACTFDSDCSTKGKCLNSYCIY